MAETKDSKSPTVISFAQFLEQTPPGVTSEIKDLFWEKDGKTEIAKPEIELYGKSDKCEGNRVFVRPYHFPTPTTLIETFMNCRCRNCERSYKTFALVLRRQDSSSLNGTAKKFGEEPTFGPIVPARVIRLIERDRDIFLKGRRAESQGMGIGAFAYYRRVVENEKFIFFQKLPRLLYAPVLLMRF